MISIAMVGRNDSHGYNMHKRIAVCINSLSHILDDPNDEILFSDCNTRDDLPTVVEAISDTLTEKTKSHLRIFRIRPSLFKKYNGNSRLPISESLSKNVAIRRSNPHNPWFLSGTSDIVVVPRKSKKSLTQLVTEIEEGFYGLPRFGVPEFMWKTISRMEPAKCIENIRRWGEDYYLNNAVLMDRPEILYDAPGDFQLCLRTQLFDICGFDERMIHCWHQDSNLAKRLFLLNGKTCSLLDQAYCYHLDHTWEVDYLHDMSSGTLITNDEDEFVFSVSSPTIDSQKNTWGLPFEKVEEIRLDSRWTKKSFIHLESMIRTGLSGHVEEFYSEKSFNNSLNYDSKLVFPYIINCLENFFNPNMIYIGKNRVLKNELKNFFQSFFSDGYFSELEDFLRNREILHLDECYEHYDIVMIDLYYNYDFVAHINPTQEQAKKFEEYKIDVRDKISKIVDLEKEKIRNGGGGAKFVIVGAQHTWAESELSLLFDLIHTQFASHVMYGKLKFASEHRNVRFEEELLRKNKELDRKDEELNRKDEKLDTIENELKTIYNSRGWKLLEGLRRFKRIF